jgi:mannitol 2-dehydrogenase
MHHLRISTLNDFPPHVLVPKYDVNAVSIGVAHIGATSNFGRSNIMPYFDAALNHLAAQGRPLDMGVVAIKTTAGEKPMMLRQMEQQDNLYTVVGRGIKDEVRVIGSVREVMNYSDTPEAVINRLADPKIKIITITGTQSAYALNKDGTGIDTTKPEVQADITNPFSPVTVPGLLVAALAKRAEKGIDPPMIISCDNIPDNGSKLGSVLQQYAAATGICKPEYMALVKTPNTMVDRITPQQNSPHNQEVVRPHGILDAAAILAEGFSKWTIEQRGIVDPRLAALSSGGVKLVPDLKAHEDMKIRGLNGAHLALGLVGVLSGEELVHKAVGQPHIRPYISTLLDQVAATVRLPDKETSVLRSEVIGRFDNAAMPDKLQRLLTETSSKVSARLVNYPAIAAGKGYEASAFAVASWMRYMQGSDDNNNLLPIADTRSGELGNRVRSVGFDTERFLSTAGGKVFDASQLGSDGHQIARPFFAKVAEYHKQINAFGVAVALERAFGLDMAVAQRPLPNQQQQSQATPTQQMK